MDRERWLLPTGIEEILPARARVLEQLRRDLLDLYQGWGYELVMPPFLDYLESLLTGTGHDLELQTLKLTDQLSGRLLGLRADMTPQVARMDAHRLGRHAPTRLCYLGTVLRARPESVAGTRSPLQIGAEIFGHAGIESDVEVLQLLLATIELAGIREVFLDLGHVGIFRGLARAAGLDRDQELALFDAMQRKAIPEIEGLIGSWGLGDVLAEMLLALPELCGDAALQRAAAVLRPAPAGVREALSYLDRVAAELRAWVPGVPIHFDLAELRGYQYKTGVVFAAFAPSSGQEIARGGRYDDIGRVFGRARPAVGFSADLQLLVRVGSGLGQRYPQAGAVLVPWSADASLCAEVERLRTQGRRVIRELPGVAMDPEEWGCVERLIAGAGGAWVLAPL